MAWTKEEDDFLVAHPEESLPWLAEQLGRCVSNVVKARRRLGLSERKVVIDWERVEPVLREKYAAGWLDTEISNYLGISKSVVFLWRGKNNLPTNVIRGYRDTDQWTTQEDAFLRNHYDEGPSWLVRHMKRSRSAIERAKKRLGLANVRERVDWKKLHPVLMGKYEEGWKDPAIAEFAGISCSSVAAWRKRNDLAAHGSGRKKRPARNPSEDIPPWSTSPSASDYSDEQRTWLKVIDSFRRKHSRPPTHLEAFRLARSLGYRKDESHVAG